MALTVLYKTPKEEHEVTNNYFAETCSGSEAGSYLRLIDFVYHSILGLRVIKKRRENRPRQECSISPKVNLVS